MITCKFEKGNKASLRHVVVDVLVVKENEILLVKRAPHLSNGGKFGLVGGYVERDETVRDAVYRETLEETGYKVRIKFLLRIKDHPDRRKEDKQNVAFVIVTEPLEKVQEGDNESTEVKWFSFDNLPTEEEMAFDHADDIQLYLEYKKHPFPVPLPLK